MKHAQPTNTNEQGVKKVPEHKEEFLSENVISHDRPIRSIGIGELGSAKSGVERYVIWQKGKRYNRSTNIMVTIKDVCMKARTKVDFNGKSVLKLPEVGEIGGRR